MTARLTWPLRLLWFLIWFTGQVISSSVRTTLDILSPRDRSSPLVLRFPTRTRTDAELALLSIGISLTPGTLVLATARDDEGRATLYVHALYDTAGAVRADLDRLQRRLLHALRPEGDR